MLLLLGALSLYSCQDPSRGTGIVTIDPDGGDGGDDVRIPDYPDDYSEIASWGDRGNGTSRTPMIQWSRTATDAIM